MTLQYSSDLTYYTLGNVIRNMKQKEICLNTTFQSHLLTTPMQTPRYEARSTSMAVCKHVACSIEQLKNMHDMILQVLLDVDIGLYHWVNLSIGHAKWKTVISSSGLRTRISRNLHHSCLIAMLGSLLLYNTTQFSMYYFVSAGSTVFVYNHIRNFAT